MHLNRKRKSINLLTSLRLVAKVLVKLPAIGSDERLKFARLLAFLRKVRVAFILILTAVGFGIVGYMVIEKYTFAEAYYMTIITLSTVGFGEVKELSHAGRMFTTILLLLNLGIFTFAVTSISILIGSGHLQHVILDLFMIEKLENLQGHHIICGYGRHGQQVAGEMHRQNMEFVVIETDQDKLTLLREHSDYSFLEGDATEDETLIEAGIKRAASILITLPDDAANLFIVISARQLNEKIKIICRSTNERDEAKLRKAGADFVILPEKLGGFYMATLVKNPNLVEFFTLVSNLEGTTTLFDELDCNLLPAEMIGKVISECGLFAGQKVQVLAIRTRDGSYAFNPDLKRTQLQRDMHLVLFGDVAEVTKRL